MVAENNLEAAKAAALRDLTSQPVPEEATSKHAATRRDPRQVSKTGRRRRKRRSRVRNDQIPSSGSNEHSAPEEVYIPEPIESVVSSFEASSLVAPGDVSEFVSVLKRFAERGQTVNEEIDPDETKMGKENSETVVNRDDIAHTATVGGVEETKGERRKDSSIQPTSRKKQKEEKRNLISRLKAVTDHPQLVDSWDVNASDPMLLVHLKTWPNSVPVPVNWRQKRKYLQNKRGMEKRAFQLPAYIVDTGVGELRDAQIEADDKRTLKQRQREKMRAKTGRGVEIDHSRLRDAFFKFQTKPRLTSHGDIYYELREYEVDGSKFRPGVMSEELHAALGIKENEAPPWLINMQRFGPPPGYPGLKIPGLSAPIPRGARFGYQVGGWGKPPIDEYGRPVYGDVFGEGLLFENRDTRFDVTDEEKSHLWATMKSAPTEVTVNVGEGEDSDYNDREEERDRREPESGAHDAKVRNATVSQAVTENGSNVRDDPQEEGNEIRKGMEPGKLYTVLQQKKTSVGQTGMMGSSHLYDVGSGQGEAEEMQKNKQGGEKRKRETAGSDQRRGQAAKKQKEFKF